MMNDIPTCDPGHYLDPLDDAIIEDTLHIDCLICGELLRSCLVTDEEVMWLPVHEDCLKLAADFALKEAIVEWTRRIGFFEVV
jgi:hypothetical protein